MRMWATRAGTKSSSRCRRAPRTVGWLRANTRYENRCPDARNQWRASHVGSTCILVADDDAGTRALIASILGRDGYRLVETEDGVEALAAAYAQRPDLLLTDIQMPLMNGVELTRRLRADLSMATLPIILVSGLHESADK